MRVQSSRRRILALGGVVVALVLVAAAVVFLTRDTDEPKSKRDSPTTTAGEQVTSTMTTTEVLGVDAQFARFSELIEAAGIGSEIDGAKAITVFAPSTEAIDALGQDRVDALKADPAEAGAFVKRHVVPDRVDFNALAQANGTTLKALGGNDLAIAFTNGQLSVDGVAVTKTDIESANGVIHVLGGVVT